jgi:biopolymer transport protein ExbB/TolQ
MGLQLGDLQQLRVRYREQTMLLLKEREALVQRYRAATEAEKAEIREQLRFQQNRIAEAHRELRAEIRREMREIRMERQKQMGKGNGGNQGG